MVEWSRKYTAWYLQQRRKKRRAHGYVPPAPEHPNQLDKLVYDLDGLESFTTTFDSTYGNIFVRVVARNNANSEPKLKAYWNGVEMTHIMEISGDVEDELVMFAAAIRGGDIGEHELKIECTSGSAGLAAVRISSAVSMDEDFLGPIHQYSTLNYSAPAFTIVPHVFEYGNKSGFFAGWLDDRAYPITLSRQDNWGNKEAQWKTHLRNGDKSLSAIFLTGEATDPDNNPSFMVDAAGRLPFRSYAAGYIEIRGLVLDVETEYQG